jgi:sugar lactone lactonase YvrE
MDDHAGDGRIIQYDRDLNAKGVLWLQNTTHLISGLEFAPDGTLWGCDAWSYQLIRVAKNGQQQSNLHVTDRGFAHLVFPGDDTMYLCENWVGEQIPSAINTVLPTLPGEDTKLGDGDLYHCTQNGEILAQLKPEVHGGIRGFIGLSHAELMPDGHTLVYISETGPRVMRYDLADDRQLPDLHRYEEDGRPKCFDMAIDGDGNVVICMGTRIDIIDGSGKVIESVSLPGDVRGWSVICADRDPRYMYVANWFTGGLIKLELSTGEVLAETQIEPKCVAGLAQFAWSSESDAQT